MNTWRCHMTGSESRLNDLIPHRRSILRWWPSDGHTSYSTVHHRVPECRSWSTTRRSSFKSFGSESLFPQQSVPPSLFIEPPPTEATRQHVSVPRIRTVVGDAGHRIWEGAG